MAGDRRDGGEIARCLDVPATRGRQKTVFDRRPKGIDKKDFENWSRRQLAALRDACRDNAGVAIGPYIRFLMAKGPDLNELVRRLAHEFESSLKTDELDGAQRHFARNISLIYVGGRLAIEAKVLPWSEGRLRRAIVRCFKDSLDELTAETGTSRRVRDVLRKKLKTADIIDRRHGGKFGPSDKAGFQEHSGGQIVYTVHAKVFRSWFDGAELNAVLAWLDDDDLLVRSAARNPAKRVGTEWAEQSPRWPNGQNVRSVVFRDPFESKPTVSQV